MSIIVDSGAFHINIHLFLFHDGFPFKLFWKHTMGLSVFCSSLLIIKQVFLSDELSLKSFLTSISNLNSSFHSAGWLSCHSSTWCYLFYFFRLLPLHLLFFQCLFQNSTTEQVKPALVSPSHYSWGHFCPTWYRYSFQNHTGLDIVCCDLNWSRCVRVI